MKEENNQRQYRKHLINQFKKIYKEKGDPNQCFPTKTIKAQTLIISPSREILFEEKKSEISREQILFMQYPMEKKGKNLKIVELRTFKIDDGSLYQISKNNEEKKIPLPNKVLMVEKNEERKESWSSNYPDYKYKLQLEFANRSPISVYFQKKRNCSEIFAFLISLINSNAKSSLIASGQIFRQSIIGSVLGKMSKSVLKKGIYGTSDIHKQNALAKLKKIVQDENSVKQLLYEWNKKIQQSTHIIDCSIQVVSIIYEDQMMQAFLKLWVGNKTYEGIQEVVNADQFYQYENKVMYKNCFPGKKYVLNDESVRTVLQFELEHPKKKQIWRSDRFMILDLSRAQGKSHSFCLTLYSGRKKMYLYFSFTNLHNLDAYTCRSPVISPIQFPIIRELYGKVHLPSLGCQIHQSYAQTFERYMEQQSISYLSFCTFKKLFDRLDIQSLIEKIYTTAPFDTYKEVGKKGTFFYAYLMKKSEKYTYYDVQKLIWKFNNLHMKRFLNVVKCFDENPRINFTEPFYYLCEKCLAIAQCESVVKWKDHMFDTSMVGRESMAFFLVVGILRNTGSLFLQQQKKSVASNSLLFHWCLKKMLPEIYAKIQPIQINIEAFFGIQSVSLFSRLFPLGAFIHLLEFLLAFPPQHTHHVLVAGMLSVMHLMNKYGSLYQSAKHYLLFCQHFCRNHLMKYLQPWAYITQQLSKQTQQHLNSQQFKCLTNEMEAFYLDNSYSGQLGEISQQLYEQFMCYKHKRQADIRKLFIIIDSLELALPIGTSSFICVTLLQKHKKIYEHEFNGVGLENLHHGIQFKLLRLDPIVILLTWKDRQRSFGFRCQLDPKSFPSNYYCHFVEQLHPVQPVLHANRYIMFQAYIKDSTDIQYLEHTLPQSYINHFLLDNEQASIKQDIMVCNSYGRNFRMRQNNMNLLYGKLGWYGCHYLVPEERLNFVVWGHKDSVREFCSRDRERLSRVSRYSRCLFGKCFLPISNFQLPPTAFTYASIVKNSVSLTHVGEKRLMGDIPHHSTINNMLTYPLDNFPIHTDTDFPTFYYNMGKLPLLSYLGYRTLQFYIMGNISMVIRLGESACVVRFSERGRNMSFNYDNNRIKLLQGWADDNLVLLEEVELKYGGTGMLLDVFLFYLRLNVIEDCYMLGKGKKSKPYYVPTTLKAKNLALPNYQTYHLFCLLYETDIPLQLQFADCCVDRLNCLDGYPHYAYINGQWTNATILLLLQSANLHYLYIQTSLDRKKYLIAEEDFIFTQQITSKVLKFTDQQLLEVKQCVAKQLMKFQ